MIKIFQTILAGLRKDVKLTLLALTLAVLMSWGIWGEIRINQSQENCKEDRANDIKENQQLQAEIRAVNKKFQDAFFEREQMQRKASENDSAIRETAQKDINKVLP